MRQTTVGIFGATCFVFPGAVEKQDRTSQIRSGREKLQDQMDATGRYMWWFVIVAYAVLGLVFAWLMVATFTGKALTTKGMLDLHSTSSIFNSNRTETRVSVGVARSHAQKMPALSFLPAACVTHASTSETHLQTRICRIH